MTPGSTLTGEGSEQRQFAQAGGQSARQKFDYGRAFWERRQAYEAGAIGQLEIECRRHPGMPRRTQGEGKDKRDRKRFSVVACMRVARQIQRLEFQAAIYRSGHDLGPRSG